MVIVVVLVVGVWLQIYWFGYVDMADNLIFTTLTLTATIAL